MSTWKQSSFLKIFTVKPGSSDMCEHPGDGRNVCNGNTKQIWKHPHNKSQAQLQPTRNFNLVKIQTASVSDQLADANRGMRLTSGKQTPQFVVNTIQINKHRIQFRVT